MTHPFRRLALLACALALGMAAVAQAQGREFVGEIVQKSGSTLVVEDRRGERARFERGEKTVVEGKKDWEALARGDDVIVRWKLGEGPRRALRVTVIGGGRKRS
jgi:hypothetical protein